MAKQKYTADQLIKAIRKHRGLVSKIAEGLDCDPTTVRSYIHRYPSIAQAMEDERERFVDVAEDKLAQAVEVKAEPWAIALVLKTLGKKRGYVERQEYSGKDGGPIEHLDVGAATDQQLERILAQGTGGRRIAEAAPGENEPR